MKLSTWLAGLLLGVLSLAGCSAGQTGKPRTEQEQKQVDDEMRKLVEKNNSQQQ